MVNIILWLISIVVGFAVIMTAFRLFGKTGLYIASVISMILVNIQVLKTVELFGMVTTLGNIMYGTTFLVTDILGEVYDRKKARIAVWTGFFALAVTVITMTLSIKFVPHETDFIQQSLINIFGIMPRIALASVTAYFCSQMHDVWAYSKWKEKYSKPSQIWIRNNASTIVSQFIDNTIFTLIAFLGVFPFEVLIQIWATTYFIKFVVALCDTPFVYLARKWYDEGKCDLLKADK